MSKQLALTGNKSSTSVAYPHSHPHDQDRRRALKLLRRQCLLELVLVQDLGDSWGAVAKEAKLMASVLTAQREACSIAHPDHARGGPYGATIPRPEIVLPQQASENLARLALESARLVAAAAIKRPPTYAT